jgi:hypothetical protein
MAMPTPDDQILARLEILIKQDIPGYERLVKQDSKFMKFLNFFVQIFNKQFMTRYVTTMYPKVYFPRDRNSDARGIWKVLAHEWYHLRSAKRETNILHSFLYGFPQWLTLLALLALLAIWFSNWWLLCLGWLICLAPLPAYFRAQEEFEAYRMSMAINYWRYGSIQPNSLNWLARQFYGSNYYFMWPFKTAVLKRLLKEVEEIHKGAYDAISPYKEVKELIEEIWSP